MLAAFAKAFRQLPDPAFRRVVIRSALLSAVVFVLLAIAVGWLLLQIGGISIFGWQLISAQAMAEFVGGIAFNLLAGVIALFLFPWVASIFIGIFVEEIAEAVEQNHYPADPPGRSMPLFPALTTGLKFIVVLVALNVLALPAYILGMFLPPLNLFVFYGLNGYLLSREYFELIAHRHMDEKTARDLRKSYKWRLLPAGILIAFLFTIPVVNLFVPLVAAAAMTHIFKGLPRVRAALQPG